MRSLLALALLVACHDVSAAPLEVPAALGYLDAGTAAPASCVDPALYGAYPDDGLDDRPGLQAAVDDNCGGSVCLRAGRYQVSRVPLGQGWDSVHFRCPIDFRGQGYGTQIDMTGDGQGRTWMGLQAGNVNSTVGTPIEDITIANLRLTREGAYNTEEQTHLLQIGLGPIAKVVVTGVWFYAPRIAGRAGGDCLRLLGEEGYADVAWLNIHGNVFADCDRSSASWQRGVSDALIESNLFLRAGGSQIDFEPTSVGAPKRVTIQGNQIYCAYTATTAPTCISLSGGQLGFSYDTVFEGNQVWGGGGINAYNPKRLKIRGNLIVGTYVSGRQPIDILKVAEDIHITGNTIVRTAESVPGNLIVATHHNSGYPLSFTIHDNDLINLGQGSGIALTSVARAQITSNRITVGGGGYPIDIRQTIHDSELLQVNQNTAKGPALGFLRMSADGAFKLGTTQVALNIASTSPTAAQGIFCKGLNAFSKPIVVLGNYLEGYTTPISCGPVNGTTVVSQVP